MMMELTTEINQFECPRCVGMLRPEGRAGVDTVCPNCGWEGRAFLFKPLNFVAEEAQQAIPEDATCAHHQNKRAVGICEGTGNYICALCMVELDGKQYSVQFVDGKGKEKLGKAFEKYMDRPDYTVRLMMAASLLFWTAPILMPFAVYYYFKMLKLRREDEFYRKLISSGQVVIYSLLMLVFVAFAVGLFGWFVFAIVS